jgi:transposase
VVVDHDSGRLVWAAPGRDKATLDSFFDALEGSGKGRCAQISQVSADGADWIAAVVANRCPKAVRCADPFHVVKWATEAPGRGSPAGLEQCPWRGHPTPRRPRHRPGQGVAACPVHAMEEPGEPDRPAAGQACLDRQDDPRLHRAYLLKEGLRTIFSLDPAEAPAALDKWVGWARRSRIAAFVALQRRIVKHQDSILAAIEHGLSNGRIESVNTKIRLITRIAFGFATPEPLIALAMLSLGGHPPALPGRAA